MAKKIALSTLIKARENRAENIKKLQDEKKAIDERIIKIFKNKGLQEYKCDGRNFRVQRNTSVNWDLALLRAFIENKLNAKAARKVVEEETRIELSLNEDALNKLIGKKKIKVKDLRKFITEKQSAPFIRSYAVSK